MSGRSPHPALAAIAPGTTVVTANKRLARTLQALYARSEQACGRAAWDTPDILPWRAWMQRDWEALVLGSAIGRSAPPGLLLDPLQEHALWRDIVSRSEAGGGLLRLDAAARLAAEARALQHAWALELDAREPGLGRDARAFLAWSREFEGRCRARGWIDGARLPGLLAAAYADGALTPPARLYLAGFDEFTPQQHGLLRAVQAAGAAVDLEPTGDAPGAAALHAFPDAEAEMVAAARWARSRLEGGGARIAIVVPDLAACRAALLRIMDDVLSPGAVLPGNGGRPAPYNVSLGLPLADYPVVHTALAALEALAADPPLARAGALLRSPFLDGAEAEMTARGLLDARLRQRGEAVAPLGMLASMAAEQGEHGCPRFAAALARWRRGARALPARLPPSAWAERLLNLLHALGWPGERTLDSDEHQAAEAWRELVCGLSSLDRVTPMMTLAEALSFLRRASAERVFQPEREDTPIQILGVLEAAGMRFDHLWVMGMHDGAWPAAPDPNPFLPLALQRRLGLPHASPERELELARRIGARLQAAAPEVRFSHALAEGDRPLRASPLLAHLPDAPREAAGPPFYRDLVHAAARLETLVDAAAPPLAGGEAPGGAALFRLQAVCPFRACAELRLHARPLGEAVTGTAAAERGTLMHEALDRLWRELGGSEALHALDEAAEGALLGRVVEEVLEAAAAQRPRVYTQKFREVEGWRLMRRLRAWLEVERGRAPFTVEHTEERRRIAAGGFEVEVRIDRVDRLQGGGRAVIDYKTGKVAVEQWFGDRPEEPQLPLYSLALGDELEAILFGCLRPGETGYLGVARAEGIVPGGRKVRVYADASAGDGGAWADQRREWARVIEGLAADFRNGRAAVDPKRYPESCRYCGLTALCRVNDGTGPVDDAAEAAP